MSSYPVLPAGAQRRHGEAAHQETSRTPLPCSGCLLVCLMHVCLSLCVASFALLWIPLEIAFGIHDCALLWVSLEVAFGNHGVAWHTNPLDCIWIGCFLYMTVGVE